MNITCIGIDFAKHVFQIHGVDNTGKAVVRKQLKRHQLLAFFAQMPPMLIGMEACGGSHYWARELMKLGHDARLMAPQRGKAATPRPLATICSPRRAYPLAVRRMDNQPSSVSIVPVSTTHGVS